MAKVVHGVGPGRAAFMDFTHLEIDGLLVAEPAEFFELETQAKSQDSLFCVIEAGQVNSSEELMDALSAALSFPDYFGRNWDAVNDCITDLEWLKGKDLSLFVRDADNLLKLPCHDVVILAKVLARVPPYWKQRNIEFRTVLCGGRQLAHTLDAILRPLGSYE